MAGEIVRQTEHRITALTPAGVVDVSAMQPALAGCERRVNVEGGKLARVRSALRRDVLDFIAATRT